MWLVPFFKTILKSLGSKPPTYAYPHAPMPKDPLVRGHVGIDINNCIFCNLCVRICPADALAIDKNRKEWEIARFQCVVCAACVEVCPKKCLHMRPELAAASEIRTKEKVTADILIMDVEVTEHSTKDSVTVDA